MFTFTQVYNITAEEKTSNLEESNYEVKLEIISWIQKLS